MAETITVNKTSAPKTDSLYAVNITTVLKSIKNCTQNMIMRAINTERDLLVARANLRNLSPREVQPVQDDNPRRSNQICNILTRALRQEEDMLIARTNQRKSS